MAVTAGGCASHLVGMLAHNLLVLALAVVSPLSLLMRCDKFFAVWIAKQPQIVFTACHSSVESNVEGVRRLHWKSCSSV